MSKTRLIIVRHGETIFNVRQLSQGTTPGVLTEKGKYQIRKLASRLQHEGIHVILSSDLSRAKKTTEAIARFHDTPVVYTSQLRERAMGIFEGTPYTAYYRAVERSGLSLAEFKPEGGESNVELRARVQGFLYTLLKVYPLETILLSTHGSLIKMLLSIILRTPIEESDRIPQENACINTVDIVDGLAEAIAINCTQHLDA